MKALIYMFLGAAIFYTAWACKVRVGESDTKAITEADLIKVTGISCSGTSKHPGVTDLVINHEEAAIRFVLHDIDRSGTSKRPKPFSSIYFAHATKWYSPDDPKGIVRYALKLGSTRFDIDTERRVPTKISIFDEFSKKKFQLECNKGKRRKS